VKKIIPLLLASLFILAGCGADPEAGEGKKIATADHLGYYLEYPESWMFDTSEPVLTLTAAKGIVVTTDITDPNEGELIGSYLRPNLTVTSFALGTGTYPTVKSFWDDMYVRYQAMFTEIDDKADIPEKAVTAGKYEALEYIFTAKLAGVEYKYLQTVFFAHSDVYILTYTCTAAAFDDYLVDVREMIGSFGLK